MYLSVLLSIYPFTLGEKSSTFNGKTVFLHLMTIFPLSKRYARACPPHLSKMSHGVHLFSSLLRKLEWSSFLIPKPCICSCRCCRHPLLQLLAGACLCFPLASTFECLVCPPTASSSILPSAPLSPGSFPVEVAVNVQNTDLLAGEVCLCGSIHSSTLCNPSGNSET